MLACVNVVSLTIIVGELTHIMYGPFVGVLARGLVFEQREEEIFSQRRVCVKEYRPRREYDINGVHILKHSSVVWDCTTRMSRRTPSLEISVD